MCQIPTQLLVTPARQHLLHRLHLGMQQRNRAHDVDAATLVDAQHDLPVVSFDESLNHLLNQYHIGAGPYSTPEAIRSAAAAEPPTTTTAATVAAMPNPQFKASVHVKRLAQPAGPSDTRLFHLMKYAAVLHG